MMFKRKWKVIRSRLSAKNTLIIIVAVIGATFLLVSNASGVSVSFEPEVGNSTGINIINDISASEGQAVQFGSKSANGWTLVFSDEFDGSSLNASNWQAYNSTYGDGNFETHCYTPANVNVNSGTLKIISKQQTIQCPSYSTSQGWRTPYRNYTSGFIGGREVGKYHPKYARYEIRAKSPQRLGLVPAIWLRHINGSSILEIDILESFQGEAPGTVTSTIHAMNSSGTMVYNAWKSTNTIGTTQDWHTWATEIEEVSSTEVEIRFYLDGNLLSKNGGGAPYKLTGMGKTKSFDDIGTNGFDIAINTAVNFNSSGNATPDSSTWYCKGKSYWQKVSSPTEAQSGWKVAETPMKNSDGSTFYRACTSWGSNKSGFVQNNPSGEAFEVDYVRVYTR